MVGITDFRKRWKKKGIRSCCQWWVRKQKLRDGKRSPRKEVASGAQTYRGQIACILRNRERHLPRSVLSR